jgi:long-chain acyl-CoA synthetase
MTVAMNWPLCNGGTVVLAADPRDIANLVRAIERERVTLFPGVPALYGAINAFAGIEGRDLRSVKACLSGSAPLPEPVMRRFQELTGSVIVEGYGLSETSPVTHCNPLRGTRKIGSIGVPMSGTDARVLDAETGARELPPGEPGELALAGPQVMRGYWNQPAETAQALKGGWFLTGDLAVMDADGYFRIVGRKKEMVNVGGFKVFPDEVDRCLAAHPAVLEAATIGVPQPGKGEFVKSFVVLRPGASPSVDELRAWLGERLAPYKVPREVEFLAALPRSTVLKVLRRELLRAELEKRGSVRATVVENPE